MPKVQIDLSDELDKEVIKFMAENQIKDKRIGVTEMIKDYVAR